MCKNQNYIKHNENLLFLHANNKNEIIFKLTQKNTNKWKFKNNAIKNIKHNLYLAVSNNNLFLSKEKQEWKIDECFLYNTKHNKYITLDYKYDILLTEEKNKALKFKFDNKDIFYSKTQFNIDFESNNNKYKITNLEIENLINAEILHSGKNVGIILSAGFSSRFASNVSKQLYKIEEKEILLYSIEVMSSLDLIIIITNTKNYEKTKNLVCNIKNIIVLCNDINDRLVSLDCCRQYLEENTSDINNVIIHDSARPFIMKKHIENLSESQKYNVYSQYGLILTNGLINLKNLQGPTIREDFFELCTPLSIKYNYFCFIMKNYMQFESRITWEFLPLINLFDKKYNLISGNYKELRKITFVEDL